jgi:hypothetical protein
MKVHQKTKQLQINEKKFEFLKTKFHTFPQITIDGLLDLSDHVDLIQKYSIEYENPNIQLNEAMYEMMKITGWKYGTMFSWNFTVTKAELSQN